MPATVLRQSIVLTDANTEVVTGEDAPIVTYDPIARTVTLSSPKPPGVPWLKEGQSYKVYLLIPPDDDADDKGLRAIDRAPLDPNQPREIAFFVGPPDGVGLGEPKVDFCGDVLPILVANCSHCHGAGSRPESGLVLDTAPGLSITALDHVATGSNTTGRSAPEPAGRVFGVNMAIVKPGNPGESWLLYKIDQARPSFVDASVATSICLGTDGVRALPSGRDYVPLAPYVEVVDDVDRNVLADYLPGREMPYPPLPALTFQQKETIRLWINQGAQLDACGACRSD